MKKEKVKPQQDVGTLQQDPVAKPYGFCCNIKDQDSRLLLPKVDTQPLFPKDDPFSVGPDIKVRIQEHDDDPPATPRFGRGGQRGGLRGAQRGSHKSRHRSGHQINWSEHARRRHRRHRDTHRVGPSGFQRHRRARISEPLGERMECKRCRGPLQWFLEDEIEVAVEKMMNKRQEKYNAEMKENIKLCKQKEKRKGKKRMVFKVKDADKGDAVREDALEDTQEEESKVTA